MRRHRGLRALLFASIAALALGCPGPPAGSQTPAVAPRVAAESREGATIAIRGGIRDLTVTKTNAYAYRDWMPRVRDPGPDGGTPLIYMVGFTLDNIGQRPLRLRCAARLRVAGQAEVEVELADMSEGRTWPLDLSVGAPIQLLMGSRNGPYLPVGSEIQVTLAITSAAGDTVTVDVTGLEIERTD